jgi:hypothetical protein
VIEAKPNRDGTSAISRGAVGEIPF